MESDKQSELFWELSGDLLCVAGDDGFFKHLNPAWESTLGWTTKELLAEPLASFIHPDDVEATFQEVARQLGGESTEAFENRYRCKDGSYLWLEWKAIPAKGGNLFAIARDVTERKKVEQALRESEEHFRGYFEMDLIGMALTSVEKGWVQVNDRLCEIFGYPKDELVNLTWEEITHPDDLEADLAEFNRVLAGEIEGYTIDKRFIRKNGDVVYASISAKCLRKQDGSIDRFVAFVQDISERKQAELSLKMINGRMTLAADSAGIGIWDLDLVNNELVWDDWMFRLYGIKREDFGGAYEAWQQGVHPEDLERSSAEVEQAKSGGKDFDTEFRIVLPNAGVRHIKANGIIVKDDEKKPIRMIGTNIDITERKLSEQRLQLAHDELERRVTERTQQLQKLSLAVEQSPTAVFITDLQGTIEYVNPKFTDLTGFTPAEALGQNPRILKSPDTPREFFSSLWKTIRRGDEWKSEIKDKHKDGSYFWAYETIAPVKDEAGNVTHYVATHEDISERKDSELAVKKALEKTEIASRAKSDLIANMSHELRTPLNAIIGFSETMKEETFGPVGSDKNREYLDDIHNSGQHLLNLINDILDASAIEADALELHEENVNINNVIDASVRLIMLRAEAGQVAVSASDNPEIPLLYVDERRVKQVLLNLLSNAVKFTPEGGEVSVNVRLNDNGSLAVSITDTGIGMDEEEVTLAMSTFGQVDSGLDRKHEGTGLGLPLTKGLIELHGGTMEIKSEKDHGTSIKVIFPKERVGQNVR